MDLSGYTAIFGGSFNPPHMGHQLACLYVLEAFNAAEVWMEPAYTHPFGKDLVDFDQRVAMCHTLAAPLGARVKVREDERQVNDGRTYFLIRYLKGLAPERSFALMVGADILEEKGSWYRWQDIENEVPIVAIGRAGAPPRLGRVEMPDISSREVRTRIENGQSLRGLVPYSVYRYIEEHSLYRG